MNRIYQGRVSKVEMSEGGILPKGKKKEVQWLPFHSDPAKAIKLRDEVLPELVRLAEEIKEIADSQNAAKNKGNSEAAAQIKTLGDRLHELRRHVNVPWESALAAHHELFHNAACH